MPNKPLVAIVGRPNVGKSTLFNRLAGERLAIVEDTPGTTRDRLYTDVIWRNKVFTLVDTGGLVMAGEDEITRHVRQQVQLAIAEADVIVFLTDITAGLLGADQLGGEEQLFHPRRPHQSNEPQGIAQIDSMPQTGDRDAEARIGRGIAHIARRRDLEASSHGEALDERDGRLGESFNGADEGL